jgi:hypothetical protein
MQTLITKGKAVITPDGLRCRAPRDKDPTRACNKLLVKRSAGGQIAGNFRCERCSAEVEVEVALKST